MKDYEERDSALIMKMNYFQRKLKDFKEELDFRCGVIRESKAKLSAAKEIESLRDHMRNNLNEEVTKKNKENDSLRKAITSLSNEKFDIENQNIYFQSKIMELRDDNNNIKMEEENFKRKTGLIEREVHTTKEKFTIKEKSKSSSLNDNDYQNTIIEKLSNELYNAKTKNEELIRKIEDFRDKVIKDKDAIIYERKLYDDLIAINEKMNTSLVKRKQEINTIETRIKNIKLDITENQDLAANSQKDGDLLVKKLQYLYDQLFAINTTNNEVFIIY